MRILVCYDVETVTKDGARRLRKAARACVDFGQRVQKSLFECSVDEAQLEALRRRLLAVIDTAKDRLRIYRLPADLESNREIHGVNTDVDFDGPLVI
jgi:CRISPR-associated protein Cas2